MSEELDPELDRQYNARASVPDYGYYERLYRSLSEQVYAALPHVEIAYGPGDRELLDVFPHDATSAPVFVFIHGGYWRALSKEDSALVAPALHAAGAVVVTLDYALAPVARLTEIVEQTRRALAWVHREIAAFGGDPERIVVSGSSAGGHLTGMALAEGWHARHGISPTAIRGALPLSGLFDIRPLRSTHINEWMRLDERDATENSPLLHLPARTSIPVAAFHGAREPAAFAGQSRVFADEWAARGGPARYGAIAARDHFSVVLDLRDPGSEVGRTALELLGL